VESFFPFLPPRSATLQSSKPYRSLLSQPLHVSIFCQSQSFLLLWRPRVIVCCKSPTRIQPITSSCPTPNTWGALLPDIGPPPFVNNAIKVALFGSETCARQQHNHYCLWHCEFSGYRICVCYCVHVLLLYPFHSPPVESSSPVIKKYFTFTCLTQLSCFHSHMKHHCFFCTKSLILPAKYILRTLY
jgi:hypothetical protein